MRSVCLVLLLGGTLGAQSLVEYSGAAAGGAAGGVAGKKVSDGLTAIFNKVDKATAKAARDKAAPKAAPADKADKNAPLFDVGPGVPHSHAGAVAPGAAAGSAKLEPGSVPAPPEVHRTAVRRSAPRPAMDPVPPPIPPPPPPPPPMATAADLRSIALGTDRDDVLKLGVPAARIMMYDDGHVLEIYRYMLKDRDLGVIRLSDGAVSSVRVN
jgi:hypothetical protein